MRCVVFVLRTACGNVKSTRENITSMCRKRGLMSVVRDWCRGERDPRTQRFKPKHKKGPRGERKGRTDYRR